MIFKAGQKIVCVNAATGQFVVPGIRYRQGMDGLKAGEIYTVRDCVPNGNEFHWGWPKGPMVWLQEIIRPIGSMGMEPGYAAARFVPVQENGMQTLRRIAAMTEIDA